jgi:hypothetical protein
MRREDVTSIIGPADDHVIAEIIATGATPEELAEAWSWTQNDEPLFNVGRRLASGRTARLVDILIADHEEAPAVAAGDDGPG